MGSVQEFRTCFSGSSAELKAICEGKTGFLVAEGIVHEVIPLKYGGGCLVQ